ncbi:C4-dicarboxylate TRAP transporter substrate-binding protein [Limibacillus halophilus]|uniref:TRAP-type C4-dicarboxylate transport system substrate-binding protein n=1 Tax=Limibacillus halophilus TaxID=1579333 RepID=A0A839ST66_9PROT|nr:C4-dicarboxylate TRAP transporter substrate-binding protein [Limibacillus halophilus]MBB3064185.1 TRAP-type C4-dicarboxylate transport system substrate-binding protein [Limibacillus halophilus]
MKFNIRAAGMGLAAALAMTTGAQAATEINASIWFPDTHPLTKYGYVEWAKTLEAASNGDIKVNLFTGTALLPPNAHLSGLQDGIAHLTYHAGTYTPTDLPEDNTLSILGFGLRDIMTSSFAVTDFFMNDPEMKARFDSLGIVFAGGYATPQYTIMCAKEVKSLDDMKGLKIRMPGPVHAEWARSIGAVPVSVPSSEMFTGLERGQLDCASNAANDLKSRSLWDVAKYTYNIPLGVYFAGWEYAFNKDFWGDLEAGQRRIILDTISDTLVDTMIGYVNAAEEALAEAPSHGVTVTQASAEDLAATNEFAANIVRATAIKEGTERFNVPDPEGLVARFEATLTKWEGLLDGIDRADAAALKKVLKDNLYSRIDAASYGN